MAENKTNSSESPSTPPIPTEKPTESKKETTDSGSDEDDSKQNKKTCTSVKDYGVWSDQNFKYRRRMEDAHYCEDGFNGNASQGFFAVYDGHGGKDAAVYASANLHKILAEHLNKAGPDVFKTPEKVQEIMKTTYLETDNKMKTAVPTHHGCTSVTCLITGTLPDRHLFAANCGDARAVLCRGGKAIRLTQEHKASDEIEAKRIQSVGGFIINGRVNGQIVITRSLGDHLMKDYIIGEPYLQYEKLTDKDTHLVVACDGLWDVCDDQGAVDFVLKYPDADAAELSKRLLVKALQDGSTDNLSIIVVKLL
jgi:protein phosphatase PTC1